MRSFEAGIEASAAATSTLQRKPNNNNGNLLPAAYGVTGGHLDHSSGSGHVVMSGHSHPGQSSPKLKKKGFFWRVISCREKGSPSLSRETSACAFCFLSNNKKIKKLMVDK